ncbi:MAG TPA: nitrile hydratase accessory protein [Candidatus Binataceae bacterium]
MKVVAPAAGAATAPGAANTADAVFAAPWEARAFALAVTLSGGERFAWDDFRDLLIAEIAAGDAAAAPYYERWLAALEKLLCTKAMLNAQEIDRRAAAIAASPPAPTKAQGRGPIKIA